MSINLFQAHNQWANRPADERFWDLADLKRFCVETEAQQTAKPLYLDSLRIEAQNGDLAMVSESGRSASLSNWAFGQLCAQVGAPASYLKQLPARLAAENLNHGLMALPKVERKADHEHASRALFQVGNGFMLRALTSAKYSRIWDSSLVDRLMPLTTQGWKTPPARPVKAGQPGTRPATLADVQRLQIPGLSVQVGDPIAPAGVYKGDRDMFIFMVNEDIQIEDGAGNQLGRGFFLRNSEVGAAAFEITTFLYAAICGNHICWGAQNVKELSIRHIGSARERALSQVAVELKEYANEGASVIQEQIKSARKLVLGASKEDVIDAIFKRRIPSLSRGLLGEAYEVAASDRGQARGYGDPRSLWGMAQGLTEVSQRSEFASDRYEIDTATGKLLSSALS